MKLKTWLPLCLIFVSLYLAISHNAYASSEEQSYSGILDDTNNSATYEITIPGSYTTNFVLERVYDASGNNKDVGIRNYWVEFLVINEESGENTWQSIDGAGQIGTGTHNATVTHTTSGEKSFHKYRVNLNRWYGEKVGFDLKVLYSSCFDADTNRDGGKTFEKALDVSPDNTLTGYMFSGDSIGGDTKDFYRIPRVKPGDRITVTLLSMKGAMDKEDYAGIYQFGLYKRNSHDPSSKLETLAYSSAQIDRVVNPIIVQTKQIRTNGEFYLEFIHWYGEVTYDFKVEIVSNPLHFNVYNIKLSDSAASEKAALANSDSDSLMAELTSEIEGIRARISELKSENDSLSEVISNGLSSLENYGFEIDQLKNSIQKTVKDAEDSLPEYVKSTEKVLLNEIEQLMDFTAGKIGVEQLSFPFSKNDDPNERILNNIDQLQRIKKNTYPRFQNLPEIQALKSQLNEKMDLRKEHSKELEESHNLRSELETELLNLDVKLDSKLYEQYLNSLNVEFEKPVLNNILIYSGNGKFYQAGIELDSEILEAMNSALEEARTMRNEAFKKRDEAQRILFQANKVRQELKREFLDCGNAVNNQGEVIADLTIKSACFRSVLEVAEVALSARKGGILGAAAETVSKVVEFTFQGGELFTTFDESELRKQMMGDPAADVWGAYGDRATSEMLQQASLSPPKQLGLQVLRHRQAIKNGFNSLVGRADIDKLVTELGEATQNAEQAAQRLRGNFGSSRLADRTAVINGARKNLEASSAIMDYKKRAFQKAQSEYLASGVKPDEFHLLEREFKAAVRANKSSINDYVELKSALNIDALKLDQANEYFETVKERIKKLKKVKLSGMVRDIGADFGVAALKEGLKMWMDNMEQQAWMEMFETEIALSAATKAYLQSSNHYWNCMDVFEERNVEARDLEDNFRNLSALYESFLEGEGSSTGLKMFVDESFSDFDAPLTLSTKFSNITNMDFSVKILVSDYQDNLIELKEKNSNNENESATVSTIKKFSFDIDQELLSRLGKENLDFEIIVY